ncbi:leucine-rich repeat protein [Tanacetum coccineum]
MANHWFLLIFLILSIYFAANIHTCLCALNISAVCSKQERSALLKFKHSVNDCCQWERFHCDKVTGKVDSLHLRGREDDINRDDEYLIGKEVITSIGDLRHLKFLDLSANFGIISLYMDWSESCKYASGGDNGASDLPGQVWGQACFINGTNGPHGNETMEIALIGYI